MLPHIILKGGAKNILIFMQIFLSPLNKPLERIKLLKLKKNVIENIIILKLYHF